MVKIPLVPQWNLNSGCVCTPDGGFLYAGSRSINFISSVQGDNDKPQIKCFHTRQGILSLDIDPHWGQKEDCITMSDKPLSYAIGDENKVPVKLFAALLQDNSVQIWDFRKGCAIQGHKAHLAYMRYMEGNGPSPKHTGEVLISYMCNRNVLSIDNQDIVVYCVASNSFYRRPVFISSRNHQMSFLKCSPYNENQFAIGTKRGLVLLCDLQKMTTLYTLRGHDTSITSLCWNRIDVPAYTTATVAENTPALSKSKTIQKEKQKPVKLKRSDATMDADEIFDIYDYEYLENEFGAPSEGGKIKNDFVSEFVGIEKPKELTATAKFDFAEACQSLKEEINALREEKSHISPEHVITLGDCMEAAKNRNGLSSCGSEQDLDDGQSQNSCKESSDDSLVRLACRTPSSESVDVDGMHRNVQQNIICQADVHYMEEEHEENQSPGTLQGEPNDDINVEDAGESGLMLKDEADDCKLQEEFDVLLASSSADGTFCVWNAKTGAACDTHKIRSSHGGKSNSADLMQQ